MLRAFIFIIILLGVVSFVPAQATIKAVKFFEYEKISESLLKKKVEEFNDYIKKNPMSQAYIFNYGTIREIKRRLNAIQKFINHGDITGAEGARITFMNEERNDKFRTIIWIVPPGGEMPNP